MENTKSRKSMILVGAIALTVLMILSATFAWFVANSSVKNRLATQDGLANVRIQEVFVEPDDWKPGQNITKEVSAINTGDAPALVRVSFDELLKVNLPATGEGEAFSQTMQDAGKSPLLIDSKLFTNNGWFEVTTTAASAERGGIKLADDYGVSVYARYNNSGAKDSYEFIVVSQVGTGLSGAGSYQQVEYDRSFNAATKTLSLSNVSYMTYQGSITETVDWTEAKPTTAQTSSSRAEAAINALPAVAGNYPGNIKLNYDNISTTPEAGKWFYNELDGYFYFIGRLDGASTTPKMLKSLLLDPKAGSEYYSNLVFELTVNMNAIQNTKDAVADQWKTLGAADSVLSLAIAGLCE